MDMFRCICTRRFCTLRQLKDKIYDNPETINFNETKEKLVSLEKEMKTPHIGDFSTGECVIFYTIFVGTYARYRKIAVFAIFQLLRSSSHQ